MRGTDTTSTASPGTIISGAEDCKYSQTEQILDPPSVFCGIYSDQTGEYWWNPTKSGVQVDSQGIGIQIILTPHRYLDSTRENIHSSFKCTKDLRFISANLCPDEMKYWWCWGVSRFNHLPKAYLVWFMIIKPIWVVHLTRHAEIASTKWDQREAELVSHDRWPE